MFFVGTVESHYNLVHEPYYTFCILNNEFGLNADIFSRKEEDILQVINAGLNSIKGKKKLGIQWICTIRSSVTLICKNKFYDD